MTATLIPHAFRALVLGTILATSAMSATSAMAQHVGSARNDAARAIGDAIALAVDSDRDGTVTAAEVAAASREVFVSIDADADRVVTLDEMRAWRIGFADIAAHRARTARYDTALAIAFDLIDRDDDARVAPAEMDRALAASALYADADGDGRLTVAEFRAGFLFPVVIRNALADPAG